MVKHCQASECQKIVMKELQKYSIYLRKNHLVPVAKENLRLAKKMDIPLMKLPVFSSLTEKQLLELGIASMNKFLLSIEDNTAYKIAMESLKNWGENKLPGISKYDLQPSDIVLVYAAQKKALLKFLPKYTDNAKRAVAIIDELEDYYTKVKKEGVLMLYKIQQEMEVQLKKNEEELKNSNKELEQFAYVASHDLQEPLRMITSYVQLLAKRYHNQLDEDANEFISYAVDGSNRMRILINSLLEYSRVNRVVPFEKVDLNILLQDVLQDLKDQISENKAEVKINPLATVYGDAVLLSQLFQNLIGNAIKFKSQKKPKITITCKDENKEYLFSVKDNGIGINIDYQEKIFIIFQRLHSKEKYPGTGIGLSICKKIVERHNGKIWLESEIGKGSTFYFTIQKK